MHSQNQLSPEESAKAKKGCLLLVVIVAVCLILGFALPNPKTVGREVGYKVSIEAGANRGYYLTSPNWKNYIAAQAKEHGFTGSSVVDFEDGFLEGFRKAAAEASR